MKYFRLSESVIDSEIGRFPQVQDIGKEVEEETRAINNTIIKKNKDRVYVPETQSIVVKGLLLKSGKVTDILSTILAANDDLIISSRLKQELENSMLDLSKSFFDIPEVKVKVSKKEKTLDYFYLRALPLPFNEFVDFKNSEFKARIAGLGDNIGFSSFEDFLKKNKEDVRWSMVFGKRIKFKKPIEAHIFSLGKIKRHCIVSEEFKNWFEKNEFTGGRFTECGDENEIFVK